MSYIGNTIRAADDYRLIDDISSSFNGSTTSFALQVSGSAPVPFPKSPQQVLISVNGVIQEPDPTGSSGFNLVGTNIVFSSAPTNGHAFFGIIYATADYLNSGGNFPVGSLGAPSITFVSDENTGIYRKGSGSVAFVADATEIANTDSNGLTISSGDLILGDNRKAKFGAGSDLEIFHDGSINYIDSKSTQLRIETNVLRLRSDSGETFLEADANGAAKLYFDNAKKAETVTGGFTVTGVCTATSFAGDGSNLTGISSVGGSTGVDFNDNVKARFGTGNDLEIFHDGSNSFIKDAGTGSLLIDSDSQVVFRTDSFTVNNAANSENLIYAVADGGVILYYDSSNKLQTHNTGIKVGGQIWINNSETQLEEGSGNSIRNKTNAGYVDIGPQNSSYTHYQTDRPKHWFNTVVEINGNTQPHQDNTYNLGTSSLRWANIFTTDLNLSNEGSSNDVDGTWGDWTIQEGESDLFLKNNRSGKKYKFNLTEVS